ncbi:hypothetical protein NTGHW29_750010 [Candidatus Nitrotoga sp. HW29]|uniref:hypothetical protein n=1 Tax=Candidatus Nitrotoga sp. HW29 TaxID=2886963 RepID=UPI001EF31F78|nr:hypothetical protein [Candidatus Nitrotoga sp. HW29]CAH1906092.1 hypothetical protein NTGHW29_750010 [Candidatus Nitrotoga sp. HW29]
MNQILLNLEAIEISRDCPAGDCGLPSQTLISYPIGFSRRRFIQSLSAVATFFICNPAKALQSINITANGSRAALSCDNVTIWSIDTSWLAGNPRFDVCKRGKEILISLTGSRYPGTDLSADFQASIFQGFDSPVIQLKHSLATELTEAPLIDWLSGKRQLSFSDRDSLFSAEVGNFLHINQTSSARVFVSPSLALNAAATNGWNIGGTEFSGQGDSFTLSRMSQSELVRSSASMLRSQIIVNTSSGATRMSPLVAESKAQGYSIGESGLSSIRIEAAEGLEGLRHYGFLSDGAGEAVVSKLSDTDPNIQVSRVLTREPRYGRALAANGQSHALFAGEQGQGVTLFGQYALLTAPPSDGNQVRVESKQGTCVVDCGAYPQSLSIASDADVSITMKFPRPADLSENSEKKLPAICSVFPFTFTQKELSLEGAEITFKKPTNALLLKFRFHGFKLIHTWKGTQLHAERDCRLTLLAGAQALLEQAYFEPPIIKPTTPEQKEEARKQKEEAEKRFKQWMEAQYDRSGASPAGRQKFIDDALTLYKGNDPIVSETIKAAFPSEARISGESQLVFRLKRNMTPPTLKKLGTLELSLSHLLDQELWELVVVQDAASSETARDDLTKFSGQTPNKDVPPSEATYLEMPSSLYISPNENAHFKIEGLSDEPGHVFKDIFRLVGDTTQTQKGLPLRAIGTQGFITDGNKLPEHYDPGCHADCPDYHEFRTALDARDRAEFVWLSSQWGRRALLGTKDVRILKKVPILGQDGKPMEQDESSICTHLSPGSNKEDFKGVYVPQPFYASKLMLSSLGGSLKSLGRWDPPALCAFALSVERWEHSSTFARQCLDEVVYKGFLLPFGIRASLIKVTRRQKRLFPELGVMSIPVQQFFLELSNPTVEYSEFLAPHKGRTWPFRRIDIQLHGRLQIDDPTNTDFCNLGQSAFRICVGGLGYHFDFEIDGDPKRRGNACFAFVDNTVAHNKDALEKVTNAFNWYSCEDWAKDDDQTCARGINHNRSQYSLDLQKSKVQYAPSKKPDDTSHITERMWVKLGMNEKLVNSAVIEASGKPPTFPEMEEAEVIIPAVNRLTGRDTNASTNVSLAEVFKAVGFDIDPSGSAKNDSEVFLKFTKPILMSFSGKGDRAGAVGTPNMEAQYLSRTTGLMGKTDKPLTPGDGQSMNLATSALNSSSRSKVNFQPAELFSPDAKLLGVIPFSNLFDMIGLSEVPRFIESTRHKIDSTVAKVEQEVCTFVVEGLVLVGHILSKIEAEVEKFESLLPLQQHLNEFKSALGEIQTQCSSGFDPITASTSIAKAGSAAENAGRYVDSLAQNPALLLPAPIIDAINAWTLLVKKLSEQYRNLQSTLSGQIELLKSDFLDTVTIVTTDLGEIAARQLNIECTKLFNSIERTLRSVLPTDQQIEQFLEFYTSYQTIYAGIVGQYKEVSDHLAVCEAILLPVAKLHVLLLPNNTDSFVNKLTSRMQEPLVSLDAKLRKWPENAAEDARAFFRRVEPSIDGFSTALRSLLELLKLQELSLVDRFNNAKVKKFADKIAAISNHIQVIKVSLDELTDATIRSLGEHGTVNPSMAAYLTGIQGEVAKAREKFAKACADIKDFSIELHGTQKKIVDLMQDLKLRLLTDRARVLPTILQKIQDTWTIANNDQEAHNKTIEVTIEIVKLCALVDSPYKPYKKVEFRDTVLKLDKSLGKILITVHDTLNSWIAFVVPNAETPQPWLSTIEPHLKFFAPNLYGQLEILINKVNAARNKLVNGIVILPGTAPSYDIDKLADSVKDVKDSWRDVTAELKRILEYPGDTVVDYIKNEIREDIAQLLKKLIPAEIRLDYNFNIELSKPDGTVFETGLGPGRGTGRLDLKSEIVADVMHGTSTANFTGEVSNFRLNVLGFLVIPFEYVKFEAKSGSGPKLFPPKIGNNIEFKGCLSFVNDLKGFFLGGSGPYVLPKPSGIKAGYAFRPDQIVIGGMFIQNLVIDAGIEIPFDDRAAVTTFAVSSRQSPALLFISPYGGSMFFSLMMAGDRLVSMEAEFSAGLVSAFECGVVVGTGRCALGISLSQSDKGITLGGFFYIGGAATVAELIGIAASLRISLVYNSGNVTGHGEFSVEIGCGFFSWTYDYTIGYQVSRISRSTPTNLLSTQSLPGATSQRQPNNKPIDNLSIPALGDLFMNLKTWHEFEAAFADV